MNRSYKGFLFDQIAAKRFSSLLLKSTERDKVRENLKIALLEEITERQLQTIHLYYDRHLTMREVGEELGIHFSTVSRTLKRARKTLKKWIKYGALDLIDEIETKEEEEV